VKRKNLIKGVTIVLLVIFVFGSSTNVLAAPQFSDVEKGSSHHDGIYWLAGKGAITGYKDGTFRPYQELSRMHAAKIFVNLFDLELPKASEVEEYFDDVDADFLYAKEIAAVAKAGIFSGDSGEFLPENKLSREQLATTIVRAYDFESSQAKVDINLKNVSETHKENVQILADLKVTDQLENFRPGEDITRGQFATFLYRSDNVELDETTGHNKRYVTKHYDYSFSTMLNKQMSTSPPPQTDSAWTWYDASESLTQYYLNPKNFEKNTKEFYQFLRLSGSSNVSTKQLNDKILKGKGVLEGKAQEFKNASKKHNVNDIYLISHALLETGNGTSPLAKGIEVGLNKKGDPERVTSSNRDKLTNIKKAYNFFGIGAVDSCAETCGSERAYSEGWFSPKEAIVGGAAFINNGYVSEGQDTLYKMRWNPDNPGAHQYATDAAWAVKQTANIERTYELIKDVEGAVINFEIPTFNKQPAAKAKPTGADIFNVNKKHAHAGKRGTVTASALNFRTGPTTNFSVIKALSKGTKVTIIGENTGWYKVKAGNQEGWVSAAYINVNDVKSMVAPRVATFSDRLVTPEDEQLLAKKSNPNRVIGEVIIDNAEVKEEANEQSGSVVDGLSKNTKVEITHEKDGWFKVIVDGKEGWMKIDSILITNVMSVKDGTEIKDEPNGETIDILAENETIIVIPNENLELTEIGDWYEANYRGQKVWVHKDQIN